MGISRDVIYTETSQKGRRDDYELITDSERNLPSRSSKEKKKIVEEWERNGSYHELHLKVLTDIRAAAKRNEKSDDKPKVAAAGRELSVQTAYSQIRAGSVVNLGEGDPENGASRAEKERTKISVCHRGGGGVSFRGEDGGSSS